MSANSGWVGCEAQTVANGGSELIFVLRAAQSDDRSRASVWAACKTELSRVIKKVNLGWFFFVLRIGPVRATLKQKRGTL